MSLEDAQIVHDFAHKAEHLLPGHYTQLVQTARTVQNIAFCCMADARQKIREERAKSVHFDDYPIHLME